MGFEPIAWLIVWFHYTSVTLVLNVPCIASNKLADHYYNQGTVPMVTAPVVYPKLSRIYS